MALGYPHPDILLDQLTARQLAEWAVYYGLEPWGERVAWHRSASICTVTANVHRGRTGSRARLEQFMPQDPTTRKPSTEPGRKQSLEEQLQAMKGIAAWAARKNLTKEKDADG